MKVALVNPNWTFDGSVYFGCREPHLPLELGYAKALLEHAGHEAIVVDAHLFDLSLDDVVAAVGRFGPELAVIATAPTYLFWRCAPPELRVPQALAAALAPVAPRTAAVGPHGSTTPRATLAKLGVDIVVMGECEDVVLRLAERHPLPDIAGLCYRDGGDVRVQGGPQAARVAEAPPLRWGVPWIERHRHHHHRFDADPDGPGGELEASRGCPYHCSFCAKENFRDSYRRRPVGTVMAEIAGLRADGATYVYFIDEIFLPNRPLLEALRDERLPFGVQTRIDLWKPEMIRLLGEAGCVSVEVGLESITAEGRAMLLKDCRMDTGGLVDRLIEAKRHIPFVQANLIATPHDDPDVVRQWRDVMRDHGIWANDPVPLFPYPGTPDYRRLFGEPDDRAWERAVDHYREAFRSFSDVQSGPPLPLHALEAPAPGEAA